MNLSATDRAMLSRVGDTLQALRVTYLDMTVTQGVFLLLVASRPGITQADIVKITGMSDASTSRVASILGHRGNRQTLPLGLIEQRPDGLDGRIRSLHLTKKGELLMGSILRSYVGITYDRPPKE